jgi:hypothetical protein
MDKLRSHLCVIVCSAIGMIIGHWLAAHLAWPGARAEAQSESASRAGVLSTRMLEVVGADGRRQIVMGTSGEGSPGIWIFDRNGKARLSIGLYGDNNASVVLNDEREQAVQIFRTVGERSAPVLVMKSQGRDRIVMGLNGTSQDPFLVLYGADGAKQSVFGHD